MIEIVNMCKALFRKIRPGSKHRLSVDTRGFKNCRVSIGPDSMVAGQAYFERDYASLKVGARTFIGAGVMLAISEQIEIGDDVLIAWGVTIVDHNSHSISFSQRKNDVINWQRGKKDWTDVPIASVKIGNKVWIGFNSIILKGVTVGEGAVVGAGSVVAKDVAPWAVVGGNPARLIREIPPEER